MDVAAALPSSGVARRKRRRRRLMLITAIIVATYVALTWIASSLLIHPRSAKALFRFVDDGPTGPVIEATTKTDDGLALRGSFEEPAGAKAVVVLFHGVGAERFLGAIKRVAGWGYVGVSFDFRGHGLSDGDVTTYGFEERRDVEAVLRFVRAKWPEKKIATWGVSLGGAALCYAADVVRDVDAVVLESVYSTIDTAFERRVKTFAPAWTLPLALPTKWLVERRLGFDPAALQPVKFTGKLRPERTLITTGAADPWATPDDMRALAAPLPGCATHLVPGAAHENVWRVGGEAYFSVVRAFLDARLK